MRVHLEELLMTEVSHPRPHAMCAKESMNFPSRLNKSYKEKMYVLKKVGVPSYYMKWQEFMTQSLQAE